MNYLPKLAWKHISQICSLAQVQDCKIHREIFVTMLLLLKLKISMLSLFSVCTGNKLLLFNLVSPYSPSSFDDPPPTASTVNGALTSCAD